MKPTWNDYPTREELDKYHGTSVRATDFNVGDIFRGTTPKSMYLVINTDYDSSGSLAVRVLCPRGGMYAILHTEPTQFKRIFTSDMLELWNQKNGQEITLTVKNKAVPMCTTCNVKLEWACMAERCPECWRVYSGG